MPTPTIPKHPAKFSAPILDAISDLASTWDLLDAKRVLDPMAGVGYIYQVFPQAIGIELMPRWAAADERTRVGNILTMANSIGARQFQLIVTSPTYGNRMADSHNAQDGCGKCEGYGYLLREAEGDWKLCPLCQGSGLSKRNTYFHQHGPEGWVEDQNACTLQWPSADYKAFYETAWWCVSLRLDKPTEKRRGGFFMVNISDHYRNHRRQYVERWHVATLKKLGLEYVDRVRVQTQRQKQGANGNSRAKTEGLHLFQRVA